MSIYLTSFYPLCFTEKGLEAIGKYNLKPYRDGSCRLEPDFEKEFPSITGLCRPRFSKTLEKGDIVIYITNKTRGKKYLIAILKVIEIKSTQEKAYQWYQETSVELPQNLMVSPNKPLPLDHTTQIGSWGAKKKDLDEWDNSYKKRAEEFPDVAICEKLYFELEEPPLFEDSIQQELFGKIFRTQNYCGLSNEQWNNLKEYFVSQNILKKNNI